MSTKAELERPRSGYIRSDQGFLHEFAADSPLEEAVRSEPVSEKPNSLFFRENTGNFIVYGPASEDLRPKMQSGSIAYELNSLRAGTGN